MRLKNYNKVYQLYQFYQKMLASPSKTNTLADELIKRTSSMLDEIESETVHKVEEVRD